MPLVKVIRKGRTKIRVEAHAELLFVPGGPIARWQNRLATAVTRASSLAAPSNSRPRWSHYGKSLKTSMNSKTQMYPALLRGTSVVGSSVGYSAFPDQGTGIYAGRSPWLAKILPPRTVGGSDLYEASWKPSRGSSPQRGVMVKGQRGQFFFEKGLLRGMTAMRLASVEVPDEVVAGKTRPIPGHMLSAVLGNPTPSTAFQAQLEEWREWRDKAFFDPDRTRTRTTRSKNFGRRVARMSDAERRSRNKESQRRSRARKPASSKAKQRASKSIEKPKRVSKSRSQARATSRGRNEFLSAMQRKYGWADRNTLVLRDGYYYVVVRTRGADGKTEYREVRGRAR